MDEMTMLRDLGRELEHEPPPTLVRQRRRMLGARRRRIGWLPVSLAAAATAVAILVPVLLAGGGTATRVREPEGVRPAVVAGAVNILVVGSDSQAGTPRLGKGERGDALLLVHVPEDRKAVTVVSIPRDSMVKLPACGGGRLDMINAAYDRGGLRCTWTTVEQLTGLRIHHAVAFDFSGFEAMVDALGGVEITVPKPVDDPRSKLRLDKGRQTLTGRQAVAWARLRDYGDGSDLHRIRRQQQLMAAMARKARQTLSDPARLRDFVAAVRRQVTTDEGFDLETMYGLAAGMGGSTPTFVTVPVRQYSPDPHRVEWLQPDAARLFKTLK
ncbi:LCP family protein [Thermoactinospora rubra]|uniref:LCP family protein n=1 Tax=Thermoactinospora rubra TaxID=1088767 RepID=UPI000A122B32|nr:LCP family protein [Thermoactinospora rubra]